MRNNLPKNERFYTGLLVAAIGLLFVDMFYLLFLDPGAMLGALLCFSLAYACFAGFAKLNRDTLPWLYGNAIFLFSFGWVAFASIFIAHGNYLTYGNFLSAAGDDLGFYENAQRFSMSGELTYSIFDMFTGVLYYVCSTVGVDMSLLSLLPINWGAAALIVVVIYSIVARLFGGVSSPLLFCVVLLGNYEFIKDGALFFRDIVGLLFFVLAIHFGCQQKIVGLSCASILAFLIRGGNGILAAGMLFLGFGRLLAGKRVVLVLALVSFAVAGHYLTGPLLGYLGSVFRGATYHISIVDQRAEMMAEQDDLNFQGGGRFDATMQLYKLGPLGIPFRYVSNGVAPIRMVPTKGMVRVQGMGSQHKMFGQWRRAYYNNLHVLLLPFCLPFLFYGLYASFRDREFNVWFFGFMFVLTSIVLFSFTDRHKLLFLIFYPIFVELGVRAARRDDFAGYLRLMTWGLVALLYPLNLYLMAR